MPPGASSASLVDSPPPMTDIKAGRTQAAKHMKRIAILVCGLAMLTSGTQLARAQDSLESDLNTRLGKASRRSSNEAKANETMRGKITYSGIAVELLKTDSLLQLFNPFAPAKYGSAADNTIEDPATGKPRAWKLFSIQF
jgi:hypothetical protein